jgi:putative ubiquitin-RnfH superfamily antitoxin RatB of RatAB toxin-antitoxin module
VKVLLAIAWPDRQEVIELSLPGGACVADAIAAARLAQRYPGLDIAALRTGIWSKACKPDVVLREGDRVELYRALIADPKEERRERARAAPKRR